MLDMIRNDPITDDSDDKLVEKPSTRSDSDSSEDLFSLIESEDSLRQFSKQRGEIPNSNRRTFSSLVEQFFMRVQRLVHLKKTRGNRQCETSSGRRVYSRVHFFGRDFPDVQQI